MKNILEIIQKIRKLHKFWRDVYAMTGSASLAVGFIHFDISTIIVSILFVFLGALEALKVDNKED